MPDGRLWRSGLFTDCNTGNVLMFYYKEHLLFDLTPGEGRWAEKSIKHVAQELHASGANQLLEKFGSDDLII